jgi:glycosyltransferase involved in cell wall biosynthesis
MRRPRIGLDLLALEGEWTGMSGTAAWVARLAPDLAPDIDFVYFLPGDAPSPAAAPNVTVRRLTDSRRRGARVVREQWHLAIAAARERLDLLHTVAYGPPALYRGRKLLTVHDLGFRRFPESMPFRWRAYWNWVYGPAARGAAGLIAVSRATRDDLVALSHVPEERIAVVHHGVDPVFYPAAPGDDPKSRLAALGLPTQFLLSVGTLQPRKDLETLLGTFARVAAARADLDLVVCGGRGWGYPGFRTLVRGYNLEGRVHAVGFVPPERLPDLYRAARALVFTSRYEGFGLPPLEAMASGVPVVATDTSAIPEVTGDAALLAPVGDSERLSEQVLRLMTDSELRQVLVTRGLERARLFPWEAAARKTVMVYRALLAGGAAGTALRADSADTPSIDQESPR